MDIFLQFAQYMPHGMCLLWQPWLVILWAGSDALIFTSYMAIPMALMMVLRKRINVPHPGLIILFASFILLCGVTHLLGIVTLWVPIYPFVGLVKLATGIVSMATAIALFRMIPTLISLPSPEDYANSNERLREEIASHEATLADLRAARDNLEAEVAERTAELRKVNSELAILAREAVHRSRNLLTVVTSLAQMTARGYARTEDFLTVFQGRINALADATAAVLKGADSASEEIETIVRKQLDPMLQTYGDRITVGGPSLRIGSVAAQQISLALHELATNAQKYGSLNADGGRVDLSWTLREGARPDRQLSLEWRERLSAPFDHSDTEGFGTKLLTLVVPRILKGEAERIVENDVLIYRLRAPLAAVVGELDKSGDARLAVRIVDEEFGQNAKPA